MTPVHAELRSATADDIATVLAFWDRAAEPTSTDSAEGLDVLLRRDPGALIIADADGHVVGTVIAGWDGWRGAVYRLAVDAEHRRDGLGRSLLQAAEDRLAQLGARRLHAIVVGSNADGVAFWEASEWAVQAGQLRYAKGAGNC
jgi:ribosomal protein S18 acetylase RimI-like enzyme